MAYGPDDIETAVAAFREISQIEVEDGIAFEPASIRGLEIRKETGYGDVRIDLQAKLDDARIALQVDIGFGDAVTPAPETVNWRQDNASLLSRWKVPPMVVEAGQCAAYRGQRIGDALASHS
ncbi:nucleotidyl transferase AbiEii/AbiGii toxin family protein [Ralstonia solanacearum]|uniref:nucleotidyl transferase AbiEii/AbiGii toxin family protein n=1 Tax=Ralstonia solanacearum TaxID=305 RepID=UPI001FFC1217|nr:nucleotidyl transferase AbiEii/AbiGii toxin family protein [Ralstonia solanacearum]